MRRCPTCFVASSGCNVSVEVQPSHLKGRNNVAMARSPSRCREISYRHRVASGLVKDCAVSLQSVSARLTGSCKPADIKVRMVLISRHIGTPSGSIRCEDADLLLMIGCAGCLPPAQFWGAIHPVETDFWLTTLFSMWETSFADTVFEPLPCLRSVRKASKQVAQAGF